MTGRVHHVFVRFSDPPVGWLHETAFSDRQDAEDERDEYRGRHGVRAVKLIKGPDQIAFILRKLEELNGPKTEAKETP